MKIGLSLLFLSLSVAVWAAPDDPPQAPSAPAPVAETAPASDVDGPSDRTPPDGGSEPAEERPLRDLTAPSEVTPEAAPGPASAAAPENAAAVPSAPPGPTEPARTEKTDSASRHHSRGEIVTFGGVHLPEYDSARTVVSILGSAHAEGPVYGPVVSILGNSTATGGATEDVVSVIGSSTASKEIGGNVVSVLGNTRVNGRVHGEVVAVLGSVSLGEDAEVFGQVVAVGGSVEKHPSAIIHGGTNEVSFLPHVGFAPSVGVWFQETIQKLRLLAFHPQLTFAWVVALCFLGFYLLLAAAANRAVNRCAECLEQRPGRTLLTAFLSVIAVPALMVVLSFTVVGPFLFFVALLVGTLFGKAAFLCFIGRRFTKPLGLTHAALSVLIGGLIVMLLYTVPVLGLLLWKLGGIIGLGMVVYSLILYTRRERPVATLPPGAGYGAVATSAGVVAAAASTTAAPAAGAATYAVPSVPAPTPGQPTSGSAASAVVSPGSVTAEPLSPAPVSESPASAGALGVTASAAGAAPAGATSAGTVPPNLPPRTFVSPAASATLPPPVGAAPLPPRLESMNFAAMPRAGFWIRVAASALDAVLVGAVGAMLHLGEFYLILLTAYCVTLWALKGTTIGGIICGLKVVRLDERKLDWTVALVRSLASFLSFAIVGVGFIWVAFDEQRQSWHDKIAGTTIVRVPRGVSLI